jgi:hypothetical protein
MISRAVFTVPPVRLVTDPLPGDVPTPRWVNAPVPRPRDRRSPVFPLATGVWPDAARRDFSTRQRLGLVIWFAEAIREHDERSDVHLAILAGSGT